MSLTNKGHYLVNMFVSCVDIRANQTFENFYVTLIFLSWSFCQDVLTVCTLVLDFCIVVCTLSSSTSFNLYYRLRWPYIIQVMLSVFGVFDFGLKAWMSVMQVKPFFQLSFVQKKKTICFYTRENICCPQCKVWGAQISLINVFHKLCSACACTPRVCALIVICRV